MEQQTQTQTKTKEKQAVNARTREEAAAPARKKPHPAAKKFPKPTPWIYYPASVIVRLFLRFKLKTRYDIKALKGIRGPAFIVCPHVSNIDFLLVAVALLPHRPTFVVSQHFMTHPKIRWILEKMHVIPKKMFCPDIKTILSIMRAKESGNLIVLFPEGRLTCFGHSLQVTDGTAELVKKLEIPVYMISEDGAYKTFPKWGRSGFRPGRILVRAEKLLEADAIPAMSLNEVQAVLERAILHDEDKIFPDVRYRCESPALGLDGILYKCPSCLAEFRMETDARHIRCTACGFEAELDETYRLHGAPFTHINDWYFWQESLLDLAIPLESETVLAAVGPDGNMDKNAMSSAIPAPALASRLPLPKRQKTSKRFRLLSRTTLISTTKNSSTICTCDRIRVRLSNGSAIWTSSRASGKLPQKTRKQIPKTDKSCKKTVLLVKL